MAARARERKRSRGGSGGAKEESRVLARVRAGRGADWALGLGAGWAAGSLLSLTLKKIKNRDKKEKKGRLGEEVGHADNFPGLTKMSLIQENRSWHECKI